MQFSRNRHQRINTKLTGERKGDHYPFSLQFYQLPPTENISLSEFETFAIERLKLLKTIENLGISYVKGSDEYNGKLQSELKKLKLFTYATKVEIDDKVYDERRKDHISHFILRLAYCQSEDLRRWFIQQEMDLFKFRFSLLPKEKIQDILKFNDMEYVAISEEEKKLHQEDLMSSTFGLSKTKLEDCEFYKVPFQAALDLVRPRKVFLSKGYAFIPHKDIITLILNDFRTRLSKALALSARSLPIVQSDERLQPLLSHLSHSYTGQDFSSQKNAGKISLDQIDALATKSFPLCMRQLHKSLREHHHLRHGGRMQYGLFLKAIGLTLEQALQFWKLEFTKGKVDSEKFDKTYSYSIRHNYGKEGKRTDYTPYSCMKIILSNPPSQGDYHGCPFRHTDPELLKQKLQSYKVSSAGISQIMELVKGMHFQLACQKYFELTHNVDDCGFSLNHPNQYFAESQKLLTGGRDVKKEQAPIEGSQPNTSSQIISSSSSSTNVTNTQSEEMEDLEQMFSEY
ncbi:DNA primase large subunit isoform X1 [Bufo gargarizans]|uniref:DNA primase large subunit isoform X1 n=1 Tax=Bufo gargarizans TaxID=30331 RepID=UPI001CF4CB7A|nr:DNA primase large subunit isoform X1 [Bufo gargarizans]XP_044147588.1 DNA primase large subunit isoform X1 [Bufo gargarizans]